MYPGRFSMGTMQQQQQHEDTPGQTYQEVNTAFQYDFGYTEYPPELSDPTTAGLLDLENPHHSMAAPQFYHSLDYGQSSHFLETAKYADDTAVPFLGSDMQAGGGEWFQPQLIQLSDHVLQPQEQMDWQTTTEGGQTAKESGATLVYDRTFEDGSVTDSMFGSYTFANSHMLPAADASTSGYGIPFDIIGVPAAFDQASRITPVNDNDQCSYHSNYNTWPMAQQSQTTASVSAFDTFAHEPTPITANTNFSYAGLGDQALRLQHSSMEALVVRSVSSNTSGNWPGAGHQKLSSYFDVPTQHPKSSQQFYAQDPVKMHFIPSGGPYTPGPSVDAYQSMLAQSKQSSGRKTCQTSTTLSEKRHSSRIDRTTSYTRPKVDMSHVHHYVNPTFERECRGSQKKKRKVDKKADRACFICRIHHRKCPYSDTGICPRLREFFARCEKQFCLPKFTRDVQTKFAEFPLFLPRAVEESATDGSELHGIPINSPEWLASTLELIKPLLPILHKIERHHPRKSLLEAGITDYSVHSYTLCIGRRKAELLMVASLFDRETTRHQIAILERHQRGISQYLLARFDALLAHPDRMRTAALLSNYYSDLCHMRELDIVDRSACDHLLNAIEHRLLYLYKIIITKDFIINRWTEPEVETRREVWSRCTIMRKHLGKLLCSK